MDFPVSYDTTTVMPDTNTFSSNRDDSDTGAFRYSYNILSHHNPQNQFNKEDSPQYIKCEKELFGKYEQWGDVNSWQSNTNSRASFWVNYNNYTGNSNYKGTPLPYFTNRQIFESTSVNPANNTVLNNIGVINATAQEVLMSYLDNFPDISNDGISYGGGPSDIGGSRDNSVTPYLDLTIPQLTSNYSKAYYNSLKIYNPAQYGQLYSLDYYPINTCLITSDVEVLFGGDCFISQITYRQTYTDDDFIDNYGDERTWWTNLITYFVESEINCKLRHESYTPDTSRWYYPYHGTTLDAIYDVMFNNDYIRAGSGSNSDVIDKYVQGDYCFNEYNYNSDYSKEQELKPNFPIALGYDYCGICSDKYPYRVVFSEKSYQEDLSDSYRRFPANNYRDLQANTGEIFNIFRQSDELYIRTENTLWFIPTKQQQLQTDQSVIQVGTGDFFSLPPKELQSVTVGYNGGQTSLDLVVNEYGAIYADVRSGIVFLLRGGQQTPISTNGNKIWFRENLSFKLLESNPSFPLTDNPTCKVGIGLIGYYDPKFKRYILTKRDYVPLYPDNSSFDEESNTWIISQDRNFIQVSNPYESPLYFENKSWTMSYYLDENKWVSWHSYLPNYAYNNRSNFYSFIYTNNYVWKHNDYNYTTFYGVKYPFIVEYINTKDPLQTKIINNISYIASTQLYDSARKQWLDYKEETFNQGIFYNDSQSTGLLDIKLKNLTDPFASVLGSFDPSEIFVERTESNWNIANIRDMVDQTSTNQAIFSSNWIDTQNKYFIDKVPNSSIINYLTKSQFEMEPMRDNYLACRFFYIPIEDKRIIVKFLENDSTFSIR